MPKVKNPNLEWARKNSLLTIEEAAHKLNFKDSKKYTAVEKLVAIESGKEEPTRSILLECQNNIIYLF